MKKQDNQNGNSSSLEGLSDISTIRNILMGEQIQASESKLQTLQNRIDEQNRALHDQMESTNKKVAARFSAIEQEMADRFDKLEQLVLEQVGALEKKTDKGMTKLNERLEKTSISDKKQIGKLLTQMGERLMKD